MLWGSARLAFVELFCAWRRLVGPWSLNKKVRVAGRPCVLNLASWGRSEEVTRVDGPPPSSDGSETSPLGRRQCWLAAAFSLTDGKQRLCSWEGGG